MPESCPYVHCSFLHSRTPRNLSSFTVTQCRDWSRIVFSWMSILLLFQIAKGALLSCHVQTILKVNCSLNLISVTEVLYLHL